MAKSNKSKSLSSLDFESFKDSFRSLDPQNPGLWPLSVKLVLAALILVVILALAWAFPVSSLQDRIAVAETEQQNLLDIYAQKESKARNLQKYKDLIRLMDANFATLLDQLPKQTRIPELVEDINMRGVGSGVEFEDIRIGDEVTREFFIEQPLTISASGDYHEFGNFISGIADLSRIITVGDFKITNSEANPNQPPILLLELGTKTYRSKEGVSTDTESTTPAGVS